MKVYIVTCDELGKPLRIVAVHSNLYTAESNADRLNAKHEDRCYDVVIEEVIQ